MSSTATEAELVRVADSTRTLSNCYTEPFLERPASKLAPLGDGETRLVLKVAPFTVTLVLVFAFVLAAYLFSALLLYLCPFSSFRLVFYFDFMFSKIET